MSEFSEYTPRENNKSELGLALQKIGIDFPNDVIPPEEREGVVKPREWLVRGHSDKNIFTDPQYEYKLQWLTGELTRGGVSLGDNEKPVMRNKGIYLVYRTDSIEGEWLIRDIKAKDEDSTPFDAKVKEIAELNKLDTSKMGGYTVAAMEVQKLYNTYEVGSGKVTLSKPYPLSQAHAILVQPGYFTPEELPLIPEEIKDKFIELPSPILVS